ncbi:hypothetical protein B0H21DRAFT_6036 [Amylocystis lapponica]|nr:hypothetical protein B0H21DRAFT_6036 [Amylocystis lapponica]
MTQKKWRDRMLGEELWFSEGREFDPTPMRSTVYTYYYLSPGDVPPDEWAHFMCRARHVQSICYGSGEDIDASVISSLTYYANGEPILPRLRELIWRRVSPFSAELLPLLSSSLLRLTISAVGANDNLHTPYLPMPLPDLLEQVFFDIFSRTPSLREFKVQASDWSTHLLLHGMCGHLHKADLIGFDVTDYIWPSVLPTFSRMERLVDLHINLWYDRDIPPLDAFGDLQHLRLEGMSPDVAHFLANIAPRNLLSLEIQEVGQYRLLESLTDSDIWPRFLSLRRLVLDSYNAVVKRDQAVVRLMNVMKPHLDMCYLEDFCLFFGGSRVEWSDTDLRDMAASDIPST